MGLLWLAPVFGQSSWPTPPEASINTVKYDQLESLTGIFSASSPAAGTSAKAAAGQQSAGTTVEFKTRPRLVPYVGGASGGPQTSNLAASVSNYGPDGSLALLRPCLHSLPLKYKSCPL
jgi:hypothetical protein